MTEQTKFKDLNDPEKDCAVTADLTQLKRDLHTSMTTMMSEMMSTMKDDMSQQFEDHFASLQRQAKQYHRCQLAK